MDFFLLLFAHVILNAASILFDFFVVFIHCFIFIFFLFSCVFFVVVIIYMIEIKHSVQIQVQFHDAYICKILLGVSLVFKLLPWLSQVLSKQGRRIAEHSSYQAGIHQVSCVVDRTNNTTGPQTLLHNTWRVPVHFHQNCSCCCSIWPALFIISVPTSNRRLDVQSTLNTLELWTRNSKKIVRTVS